MGLLRLLRFTVFAGVIAVGAMALWRRRESVKQVWDSAGGANGIKVSANRLMDSAGPIKNFVSHVANLK